MAKTANKGFFYRKSLIGQESPATADFLLDDSATFTVGDAVSIDTDGLLVVCGATTKPIGVLAGIVNSEGTSAFSDRATGTSGATITGDDTLATASDNSSNVTKNLKGRVYIDPAGLLLFYNDSDDTLAQTNVGQCFDMNATGDDIDVATATDGTAVWQLLQIDPDGDGDASKGLFRLNEPLHVA